MKSRFVPLIASLLLAAALIFVVEGFFHQVIFGPVLYVSWFASLVVGSIPQVLFWIAFILAALVVAGKSLAKNTAQRKPFRVETEINQGAVASWFLLFERAPSTSFSAWRLAQALRKLSQDILPQHKRFVPQQHKESPDHDASFLPPEIEAYFEEKLPPLKSISRFWYRRRGKKLATALDLDPETVVQYLEHIFDPFTGE